MALYLGAGKLFKQLKDKWPLVTRVRLNSEISETRDQFQKMRNALIKLETENWMLAAETKDKKYWDYDYTIKVGDTIVDNRGNHFIAVTQEYLNERKASESAPTGTKAVQRSGAAPKGRRVQGRRTSKVNNGRGGKSK